MPAALALEEGDRHGTDGVEELRSEETAAEARPFGHIEGTECLRERRHADGLARRRIRGLAQLHEVLADQGRAAVVAEVETERRPFRLPPRSGQLLLERGVEAEQTLQEGDIVGPRPHRAREPDLLLDVLMQPLVGGAQTLGEGLGHPAIVPSGTRGEQLGGLAARGAGVASRTSRTLQADSVSARTVCR
ncbi:hypothetical protein GCM10025866_24890 [Naasia aerilata]|uniref:Uncharacterized protein n=1 Tax=Naasia aerilata TaxID=1162966 RepID=A0ABM8GE46_9MICO|nr:hypothetical protein GCM10025866_24890 [Naasia aerilata]